MNGANVFGPILAHQNIAKHLNGQGLQRIEDCFFDESVRSGNLLRFFRSLIQLRLA